MKNSFFLLFIIFISFAFQREKILERKDFKAFFDEYDVKGSFLLYDLKQNHYISYDTKRCRKGFLPASTFKIMNSMIALETGVTDTSTLLPWNGNQHWNEAWNKDMKLREAFHVSCVPCYQEIARKIGLERMKHYIDITNYGNMDIRPETLDNFWLQGNSRITQFEQIDILRKLYHHQLPFSKENMMLFKQIMIAEQTGAYTLRAKTGWAQADQQNTGWYVGYIETRDNIYFFATHIEKPISPEGSGNFGAARQIITKNILKNLNII